MYSTESYSEEIGKSRYTRAPIVAAVWRSSAATKRLT